MKTAACCMTRNEERDIVEWVLYHAWTGFDTVVVFENRSTDRTRERLDSLSGLIDIRIFDWQYEYHPGHFNAFAKCMNDFRDEFDWMALFDHDEFFVPVKHANIKDYLASMDAHASIAVNWMMYGSSGHVAYPDGLITQEMLQRAPASFSPNRFVKSIVRPKESVGCTSSHNMDMKDGIETVDVKGDPVQWLKRGKTIAPIGLEDTARFHHYFVRSQAHWEKRMAIPFNAAKRADTKFEVYDRNDVYDPIVVDKFGDVLARIAAFKAEHGV